jgi:hypothetical protein
VLAAPEPQAEVAPARPHTKRPTPRGSAADEPRSVPGEPETPPQAPSPPPARELLPVTL